MDSDASMRQYTTNRSRPSTGKALNAPLAKNSVSDSSLLNEFTLYTYDYTTGKSTLAADGSDFEENHSGDVEDETGLSFVRLLKTELSKKKIQESGHMTEEYKDNYFKLVETNQMLAKGVNLIKSKIKQYKQAIVSITEEHDESMRSYTNQMEDLKQKIVHEKSKYDEEQQGILNISNDIRDIHRKIETLENEILKTMEARKNAEAEGSHKDYEVISMNEKNDTCKQKLMQVYKEMDMVRDNSKRFNHTKKQFQEKIAFLLNTNEKIKSCFENLLLESESIKLENKSLEKVLKAHENICLELLRIAADKLDSHNDTKVLNDITAIMKVLDQNKDNYGKQKQKIHMNRQKILTHGFDKNKETSQDMQEDDEDEYHEAIGFHDGNGDGAGIIQLFEDLD